MCTMKRTGVFASRADAWHMILRHLNTSKVKWNCHSPMVALQSGVVSGNQ
jgi:hypothetical protein